jgi:DNA-binding NtrC family response regulator
VVLSSGSEIRPEDLPEEIRQPESGTAFQLGQATGGSQALEVKPGPPESHQAEAPDWLLEARRHIPEDLSLEAAVSALEEGLLRAALTAVGGVQSRAAEALGLKKNVFKYKWDKYIGREPTPLALALAEEAPTRLALPPALEALEEALLKEALERTGGIQNQAADLLGIKKNLMHYKLKKFNLHPKA